MFTLAVRRLGIDDYQPRRLVVVERAAASLSCVRTTHVDNARVEGCEDALARENPVDVEQGAR